MKYDGTDEFSPFATFTVTPDRIFVTSNTESILDAMEYIVDVDTPRSPRIEPKLSPEVIV
jgi:hypothetical protein